MSKYYVEAESEDLEIKPRQPRVKMPVEEVILRPELSLKEAEDTWLNKRFDKTHVFTYRPKASTFFRTEDGEAKLLFLRNVLSPDIYARAYEHVRDHRIYTPASNSKRAALKGSPGGDCLFGYNDQLKPDSTGRRQTHPQLTAKSVQFFPRFRGLWPLSWEMEDLLGLYVSGYWEDRQIDELHGPVIRPEEHRSDFFKYPAEYKPHVQAMENFGFWYNIPGSNFTTITVNWNTVFRAHKDARNSSGALSCLAAFGNYRHGELVFPRLDVAFSIKDRDLLICDCPRELHATIPPLGTRFSLVAYTREGLTKSGVNGKKIVSQNAPLPFEYTPNFLTKEEASELVSYFETLKFHVRVNPRNPKNPKYNIKRQSLGYIASNAFNDRDQKEWGTEYADIDTAPEILQRFRAKLSAHVGKNVNYMSILKYPDGNAHIDWHQHGEDRWHDSPVWDVSVGPTERMFWAREIDNPKTTKIGVLAEVGSLITLPSSMNTTHQHAILKDKTMGVRYSINCKSLPLTGVWDCHAGKRYPADAVYVGCRVLGRDGTVLREGSIFGNGADPLVSRDGGFKTEAEFRDYAERRMQDPDFRAKVRELKGKHLLCWCVQSGPKRAEFCHARVWLEIANRNR